MQLADLTRDERNTLLYAETCVVDSSGLLIGERMNDEDHEALVKFRDAGLLEYGRVPARVITTLMHPPNLHYTHWVTFGDEAWRLAHEARRLRSQQIGPNRRKVDEAVRRRAN